MEIGFIIDFSKLNLSFYGLTFISHRCSQSCIVFASHLASYTPLLRCPTQLSKHSYVALCSPSAHVWTLRRWKEHSAQTPLFRVPRQVRVQRVPYIHPAMHIPYTQLRCMILHRYNTLASSRRKAWRTLLLRLTRRFRQAHRGRRVHRACPVLRQLLRHQLHDRP